MLTLKLKWGDIHPKMGGSLAATWEEKGDTCTHQQIANKTCVINKKMLTNLSLLQTTVSTWTLLTKKQNCWQLENMEVENSSVTLQP